MKTLTILSMGLFACLASAQSAPPASKTPQSSAPAAKASAVGSAWKSPFQAGRPSLKERPSGDKAIIHTMADALGFVRGFGRGERTETLNRLQWFGAGRLMENGHTYQVVKYSYALSLHLTGAREDIQFKAPGSVSERRVQVFLDGQAWDETTPGVGGTLAPNALKERDLRFLSTPFGFTKAILMAEPGSVKVNDPGPGGKVTISATLHQTAFTATLDPDFRPSIISFTSDGKKTEARWTAYRDLHGYGVMFPTHATLIEGGTVVRDLTIDDGRVASYLILQPPGTAGH